MIRIGKFTDVSHILVTIAILSMIVVTQLMLPIMMYINDAKLRSHVVKALMETSFGIWLENASRVLLFRCGNNAVQPIN